MASCIFIFQDQIPRLLQQPAAGITTGSIVGGPAERAITQASEFHAHDGPIDNIGLSGDGRLIVTTGNDRTLKIWNAQTQTLQGSIALEAGAATSLSVRNNRAVTGHANGSVAVYDLDSRSRVYSFKRNDASVWAATFAGTEDRIAAAGYDSTVSLWQTASQTSPEAVLEGHDNAVQALAVDPSGQWLASGSAEKSLAEAAASSRVSRARSISWVVEILSPKNRLAVSGN